MNLTTEQLKAMGYVECGGGNWTKGDANTIYRPPQTHANPPRSDSEPSGAIQTPPKARKRIRQSTRPLLNKLESDFANVLKYRFTTVCAQCLRFKLGNGIWYKPDFVAWPAGFDSQDPRMRVFEVKGAHAFRGGFENLKVAASLYPAIRWTLVWKEGGDWKEQLVLP